MIIRNKVRVIIYVFIVVLITLSGLLGWLRYENPKQYPTSLNPIEITVNGYSVMNEIVNHSLRVDYDLYFDRSFKPLGNISSGDYRIFSECPLIISFWIQSNISIRLEGVTFEQIYWHGVDENISFHKHPDRFEYSFFWFKDQVPIDVDVAMLYLDGVITRPEIGFYSFNMDFKICNEWLEGKYSVVNVNQTMNVNTITDIEEEQ